MTKIELAIAIAIIVVLGAVVVPNFLERPVRSTARDRNNMRTIATALEAYFIDHNAYPIAIPLKQFTKKERALRKARGENLMTYHNGGGPLGFAGLTTPIGYLPETYADQFSPDPKRMSFAYHGDRHGWILASPGPDGVYDINPALDYVSTIEQPSPRILHLAYDPTNGYRSGGDVFRVKQ